MRTTSGQIWVGTQSGVAVLKSGRFARVASVPYGVAHSITGDSSGNVWMSHQEGLFRLLGADLVERIPWAKLRRKEPATAVLHDARQGGLWLGFRDGGVAYFNDGEIRASYAAAEGLGEGMIRSFYLGCEWFSLGRDRGRTEPHQRRSRSDAHEPERTAMQHGSLDDGG